MFEYFRQPLATYNYDRFSLFPDICWYATYGVEMERGKWTRSMSYQTLPPRHLGGLVYHVAGITVCAK